MENKNLVAERKKLMEVAGLLKEDDFELPDESPFNNSNEVEQAFKKAKIDLDKPATYIVKSIFDSTVAPVKVLGKTLLQQVEADKQDMENVIPDFNEEEDFWFNTKPLQGRGELLGEKPSVAKAFEGLQCKLKVYFSASHLYEIWQ